MDHRDLLVQRNVGHASFSGVVRRSEAQEAQKNEWECQDDKQNGQPSDDSGCRIASSWRPDALSLVLSVVAKGVSSCTSCTDSACRAVNAIGRALETLVVGGKRIAGDALGALALSVAGLAANAAGETRAFEKVVAVGTLGAEVGRIAGAASRWTSVAG